MAPEVKAQHTFAVPQAIISPSDVTKARLELEELDSYLAAQRVRSPGKAMHQLPKISRLLGSFIDENHVNILQANERHNLATALQTLFDTAPVMHISFATEPSFVALQQITEWLRRNIHPAVLVKVGLQPSIVAGCIVRTTNKYFDFSLRRHLDEHREYLSDALAAVEAETPAPAEAAHEQ